MTNPPRHPPDPSRSKGRRSAPLQNRVDPFGAVHAVAARGLFTGNRGVLHDPDRRILTGRRWTTRAWLICALDWRGRRRDPMGRNAPNGGAGWTALFFLDEVTALAAGHRPCFHCRRAAARAFLAAGMAGTHAPSLAAGDVDRRLHATRAWSGGSPRALTPAGLAALPDGAMVACGRTAFALRGGRALPWAFTGYGAAVPRAALGAGAVCLTPPITLAALSAGYRPVWHAGAAAG